MLDGLLNKVPAARPTAADLMHHPWVVEDEEDLLRIGGMPLELDRLDDAPSLENWVQEMVSSCFFLAGGSCCCCEQRGRGGTPLEQHRLDGAPSREDLVQQIVGDCFPSSHL